MGIPRFFKLPNHRQFNYVPRYYDEKKEQLEERKKRILEEDGVYTEHESTPESRIRGRMKGYFHKGKVRKTNMSNIRILVIMFFLMLVAYFILYR
jgi:hypothetical protein